MPFYLQSVSLLQSQNLFLSQREKGNRLQNAGYIRQYIKHIALESSVFD